MKPYPSFKISLIIVLSFFDIVAFTSCQKDISPIFKNINCKSNQPVVMVAGYESNGLNNVAKSWINGQEVILSDGSNDAKANSIFISANNTYIAGNDAGPVYWENNKEKQLSLKYSSEKKYSSAKSIFVSGNEVYIAGNDSAKAVYWKDGIEVILDSLSSANSVYVSGIDLYVAGSEGMNAAYWKNGFVLRLSNLSPPTNGNTMANSINVSSGNVYVVGELLISGSVFPIKKYWKNGIEVAPSNTNGILYSVFVDGNDEYIAGMEISYNYPYNYYAVYWKNGSQVILPSNATTSFASSIYVKGNDVYVAGYEYNTGQTNYAVYWKNGVEVKLTDGTNNAYATSIFVK